VIDGESGDNQLPYVDDGIRINSGEFDRIQSDEAKGKIVSRLHKTKQANFLSKLQTARLIIFSPEILERTHSNNLDLRKTLQNSGRKR
jgi:hypothetical protein